MVRARAVVNRLYKDRFLRNNAIYFGGTVAAGLFGYIYHFAIGRLVGPAAYGVVASAIAALYLLTLPGPILQTVATRFASLASATGDAGRIRQLLLRLAVISAVVGGAISLALVLFGGAAAQYLQISDRRVVYLLAASTVVALLVAGNRGILQGQRRFLDVSLNATLDSILRVVVGVALVVLGRGPIGALFGFVAGPGIAYGNSILMLRGQGGSGAEEHLSYSEVGRYAMPAAIGVIGITFLFNADVVLAKHYLQPSMAGIYAAGSVLARVVYFLGVTIAAVMFPEVATLHARDEAHFHVVDKSLFLLGGVALAFVGAYAFFPSLVLVPYGDSFAPVKPFLGLFALSLSLLSLSNLLVNYFLSLNSWRFAGPLIGAAVLEVALIARFHNGPGQVLAMLMVTMAALAIALGALYAVDRVGLWRVRAQGSTT